MVGDARCKGIKPTWGHIGVDRLCALYERSDLMIGVDSGPFHVAALTNIKTLGIFRSLHPVRVCLPNPNATYLISTNHIHAWDIRRHKWAFSTYDGTDPTLAAITDAVISTLTMRDPAMEIREEHLPTMNEVSGRYIYRRKAYDEREMELLPDGRIGEGAAGCEQRWSLRFSDGAILIDISGKNGIICSASRIGDGFYGQWTQFEKMPVELIRIRDKQDLIYTSGLFSTRFTTARDFASPWYAVWKDRLSLGDRIHRKGWEIASVCETLSSAGVLKVGNAGIGFGVGSELLPTVFAGFGCRILATDALPESWKNTTGRFYDVNQSNGVEIRVVDMNAINGGELTASIEESAFDFSWSICSMDHCGSTWLTKRFLLNQMNCLKPGGISAHTAEYSIGVGMPRVGDTVWFTWDDIVDVRHLMTALGYELAPIDWFCGDSIEDHMIDESPYVGRVHIKCEALGQWGTCVLFAAKKVTSNVFWVPFDEEDGRAAIADFQRSHSQT
ncbi:MAG: hypothetical protein JSS49_29695 [Planctomycetes bacterium]|nr:hypothetical protein [Planctomycetota bacterium]